MSEHAKLKSMYAQHLRYLELQNDHTCPHLAFLHNLKLACQDWRATGDHLLIVRDFNGDVRGPELQEFFSSLAMREVFLTEHPNLPTLSTFTWGTNMGRSPIDGVWLSDGVPVQACSWMSFVDSPGDHRAAIMDFNINQVLGQPRLQVCRPPVQRLVCTLPATRDRYVSLLTDFLNKHQFLPKLYHLYSSSDPRWPDLQSFSTQYEHLDQIRLEGGNSLFKHYHS